MHIIDNPFQQNSVTYSMELQIKFAYLQAFVQFCETLSDSIVYFEAEDTKTIDSKPDDLWQIDTYLNDKPDMKQLQEKVAQIASAYGIAPPILRLVQVDDRDWVSEVQKTFVPIKAGRFFVHHTGYQELISKEQIKIEINAGRAFGTGEHETTGNCLKALSKLTNANNNCLDMGCGSGILAIAMAKLWNNQVTAVDLDEQAVLVTKENIQLNNVSFIVSGQSDGYKAALVGENAPYQLITANILASPLIAMAKDAAEHLAKDGILILAGFLKEQRSNVLIAHQNQGLVLIDEICTEAWPTLVMKKI